MLSRWRDPLWRQEILQDLEDPLEVVMTAPELRGDAGQEEEAGEKREDEVVGDGRRHPSDVVLSEPAPEPEEHGADDAPPRAGAFVRVDRILARGDGRAHRGFTGSLRRAAGAPRPAAWCASGRR